MPTEPQPAPGRDALDSDQRVAPDDRRQRMGFRNRAEAGGVPEGAERANWTPAETIVPVLARCQDGRRIRGRTCCLESSRTTTPEWLVRRAPPPPGGHASPGRVRPGSREQAACLARFRGTAREIRRHARATVRLRRTRGATVRYTPPRRGARTALNGPVPPARRRRTAARVHQSAAREGTPAPVRAGPHDGRDYDDCPGAYRATCGPARAD